MMDEAKPTTPVAPKTATRVPFHVRPNLSFRTRSTQATIADWKTRHELAKLQDHADKAERYAAAALEVALAAIDSAEEAALESWLARLDARSVEPA